MIQGRHPRLLAVGDDRDCSDLIVRTALKCGFEAFGCRDPRKLHLVIADWRPHVIVIDLSDLKVQADAVLQLLNNLVFSGQIILFGPTLDNLKRANELASELRLRIHTSLRKPFNVGDLHRALSTSNAGASFSVLHGRSV